MSGYSGKSLTEKLGIREQEELIFLNAPLEYRKTLSPLPKGMTVSKKLKKTSQFIQYFCTETNTLIQDFPDLNKYLAPTGMLWISWPKAHVRTDPTLSENTIRQIGLDNGLVDVKVCAIDDDWSGLKFVYRLRDR